MRKTWRDRMMPLIAQVIADCEGLDLKATREALRRANPYRGNEGWLLRVWRDECRIQLGLKSRTKPPGRRESAPGQQELFE